jgi:hypothetical protein
MSAQPSSHAQAAPTITSYVELQALSKQFDGDGRMRRTGVQEDAQHDNTRRAGIAAFTVAQFAIRSDQWHPNRRATRNATIDLPNVLADLLTSIRHLTDSANLDFEQITARSRDAYCKEVLHQD